MGKRDPRVDAYIQNAAPFAQPVLEYIRETVHSAVPEVEETMKWSFPHFDYKGMLCSMASFKAHCAFNFWKGALLFEDNLKLHEAMGHMGKITSVKDLPPKKELLRILAEAARLNDEGVKAPPPKRGVKPPLETPEDLATALSANKKAQAAFDAFSPSHRREYIEWIVDARSDATRQKRLTQAIEWIAEGKSRNWKYERP
jgi:uncharacterized protein YdeI (YjbR/CyaY-like superfamily)